MPSWLHLLSECIKEIVNKVANLSSSNSYVLVTVWFLQWLCLLSLRLLLLTPFNIIDLLSINKGIVAYTILLTALLQVYFWINTLQTDCATYDYGLYIQLACLWTWLILIIIHDPIGHQYFTHMCMLDIYISVGKTPVLGKLLSYTSILCLCK